MTLIDRLSKLDGPNREVDAAIWMHLIEKPGINDKIDRDMVGRYPSYTASVDAAIALAEREFPGIDATIRTKHNMAWLDGMRGEVCCGATPAIALCIALLRAKEADKP